jgi:pimeloyl-ACP methyl ester carboxylesterase
MWADFMPVLAKKYQVIAVDLSGFGESDLLDDPTIEAMSEAVAEVLNQKNIKKCVMVGHSMGGYVSLAFAQRYSHLLAGIGLFHSHPYVDSEEKIKNRRKTIRFIQRHGIAPFAGQFVRNLFAPSFVQSNESFLEELIYKTSMQHDDAVIAASLAMIHRKDFRDVLAKLSCPALFIVGDKDNAIARKHSLTQLSLAPVASVHIFEDVGHMGMFEKKEACLNIIADFVGFCTSFKPKQDLVLSTN